MSESSSDELPMIELPTPVPEKKKRIPSEKQKAACQANAAKARAVRDKKLLEKLQAQEAVTKPKKPKPDKESIGESDSDVSESDSDSDSDEVEMELVTVKKASKKPSKLSMEEQLAALMAENALLKKAKKKSSRAPVNVFVGGQEKVSTTQSQLQKSWSDF